MHTRPHRSPAALLGSLLVLAGPAVRAADSTFDWPPVSFTAPAGWEGADAVLAWQHTTVDDRRLPRRQSYRVVRRVLVLTDAGVRAQERVRVPLQLPYEEAVAVEARTICAGGRSSAAEIRHDRPDKGAVAGLVQVDFADAAPGCLLDLGYELRIRDVWRFAWFAQDGLPVADTEMLWRPWKNGPPAEHLILPAPGVEIQASERPTDDGPELRFRARSVPAIVHEPMAPPLTTTAAQVLTFYRIEDDPEDFWSAHGQRINASLVEFGRRRRDVRRQARAVVEGRTTPMEQAEALYGFVRSHVDNTGDVLPVGQPPYRSDLVTGNASYVLGCRCGGLLEVNRLYVSLARELGLDAGLAYGVRRGHAPFRSDLPIWRFDEEMVVLWDPETAGWRFLSPGRLGYPFGRVPAHIEGRAAFVVAPDRILSRTVPISPPELNAIDIDGQLQLDGARLIGAFTVVARGEPAVLLERGRTRLGPEADEAQAARVAALLLPGAQVEGTRWVEETPGDARVELRGRLAVQLARTEAGAPVDLARLRDPVSSAFVGTDRTQPVLLDFPKLERERWEVDLGPAPVPAELPAPAGRTTEVGRYLSGWSDESGRLVFRREWSLDVPEVGPELYPELHALFEAARAADRRVPVLAVR